MKLKRLITIGYEGADFQDFLATLEKLGITTLLDIRELPISRRRGFAKTALREGLSGVGITYRHEPRLGSPKALRHRLREDGNYDRFFRDFERHLGAHRDVLEGLARELEGTIALLCYERDFQVCHRRAVASALGELTGLKPKHAGVQANVHRKTTGSTRTNTG